MQYFKYLDGLFRRGLITTDGQVGVDNLLHAAANETGIL